MDAQSLIAQSLRCLGVAHCLASGRAGTKEVLRDSDRSDPGRWPLVAQTTMVERFLLLWGGSRELNDRFLYLLKSSRREESKLWQTQRTDQLAQAFSV